MDNNDQASGAGGNPPPKPWERAGYASSRSAPFKPPSAGNTSDIVEASGTANPGEVVSTANTAANKSKLGRAVPSRPWEKPPSYGNPYGGYNSAYGRRGMYGSYGNNGLYGNNMYRGGYSGLYGGGRGLYNNGLGEPTGGYSGEHDPNNPYGPPSGPPTFWVSLMRMMHGVVTFFGRIALLIDQNTQAFHMLISALLQLFDRSGVLYGELARFVIRILGIKTKASKVLPPGNDNGSQGRKGAPGGDAWESVWGK